MGHEQRMGNTKKQKAWLPSTDSFQTIAQICSSSEDRQMSRPTRKTGCIAIPENTMKTRQLLNSNRKSNEFETDKRSTGRKSFPAVVLPKDAENSTARQSCKVTRSRSTNIPPLPSIFPLQGSGSKYPIVTKFFNQWKRNSGIPLGRLSDATVFHEEIPEPAEPLNVTDPPQLTLQFPSSPEFNSVLRDVYNSYK